MKSLESAFVDEKVFNMCKRILSLIISSLIYVIENVLKLDEKCHDYYWLHSQSVTFFNFVIVAKL